jgi:hypothetical protein
MLGLSRGVVRVTSARRWAGARLAASGAASLALLASIVVGPVPAHADVGDCNPTAVSMAFGASPVKFGDDTTVSWSVSVPADCGMVFELIGVTHESFDAFVGASGWMVVPSSMLAFGANTWSLWASIPNSDLTWHLADRTVKVSMPVPQPDGTQVTITDDSPASRVTFVSAVMAPNAIVRVSGNVNLNLSNLEDIPVAAGVQILGDRSVIPVGPRLFTTTIPKTLLKIGDGSDGVRISGIRLEGGESDDPFSAVGPLDSDGIGVYASQHVEIDHNEIYHWRGAGVNVHDGNNADDPTYLGRLNQDTVDDNTRNVWVHDNYVHHNQHPSADTCIDGGGHAGGYGVEAADGAYVKIERNIFDWNRHSIAGDGKSGTGYVARDNLILANGGVHFKCIQPDGSLWALATNPFAGIQYVVSQVLDGGNIYHTHAIDMHAVGNCKNGIFVGDLNQFGDHNCGQAGEYMDIEYNTVLYTAGNGIHLRGTPVRAQSSPGTAKFGMDVKNNVFAHSVHDGGFLFHGAMLQNETGLNDLGNTLGLNTFNDRKSCDFDADGTADPFIATGVTWWYAASRLGGRWTYLNRSPKRVSDVTLADVNGDGMCDVTADGTAFPTTTDSIVLGRRSGAVGPGGSVTTQVSFAPAVGPRGPLTLTAAGLPPGVTASFSPPTVSANAPMSTLTLTETAGAAGTYPVTVRAGSSAQPVTFQLTLQDFTLSLDPPAGTVTQGDPVTTHVHLTPLNGFAGPVTLTAPGLPWGTTATFSPATVSAANPTATLTLTTSSDGPVGDFPVTITPTGAVAAVARSVVFHLTVRPSLAIGLSPADGTIIASGSVTTQINLTSGNGFTGTANIAVTGLPDGTTASLSTSHLTATTPAILTLTASNTPGGTYDIHVTATTTDGRQSSLAIFELSIAGQAEPGGN